MKITDILVREASILDLEANTKDDVLAELAGAHVHTPQGIFELKYFFNSSISRSDGGEALASESVKDKIRKIIESEDPSRPMSDQRIKEMLKAASIDIARRTVTKYREAMNILSSTKRRQVV